jgi:hypothetical protein
MMATAANPEQPVDVSVNETLAVSFAVFVVLCSQIFPPSPVSLIYCVVMDLLVLSIG